MRRAVGRGQGLEPPAAAGDPALSGGAAGAPTLAIVGKGVTFDSGGLSLKTPEGMLTMKCDKAGAATMVGAMQAIAQLKLPVNVIGIAGLVENMTGPAAMKLGDVLRARNGRTIEVHNTDAEGRLVLADLLSLAVDLGASKIVDLATLTGACVVALGTEVAGVMTNDQPWCDQVVVVANMERILSGFVRKVGDGSPIGRPGGITLGDARRVGQVARVALFGRDRQRAAEPRSLHARRWGRGVQR